MHRPWRRKKNRQLCGEMAADWHSRTEPLKTDRKKRRSERHRSSAHSPIAVRIGSNSSPATMVFVVVVVVAAAACVVSATDAPGHRRPHPATLRGKCRSRTVSVAPGRRVSSDVRRHCDVICRSAGHPRRRHYDFLRRQRRLFWTPRVELHNQPDVALRD